MRINRENSIGLVVDIQEKLYPVMAEKELFLQNCQKLIQGLQLLNIPIQVTQQYSKGLGTTLEEISSLFSSFTSIEKSTFSCLDEPVYELLLKKSGKTNVLICGIEAHVCVLQTAIDLQDQGFNPIVIADCISSRQLYEKQIALNRLALEGIRVSTVESVLFELTRTTTISEFKSISKLVK